MAVNADAARSLLARERDRLLGLKRGLEAEGVTESERETTAEISYHDQHPADIGSETFERSKELSILESIERQLEDVDRAMRLVESGDYGTCEACGRMIPDERLRAQPTTRFCVDDQRAAERAAGASE